jgi:5'-nucleotidase
VSSKIVSMPSTIHLRSGRMVNPLDLQVEDIDIEDIAHALGNQCRFSGHTREFYSVAEHSVRASYIVDPEFAYDALLHDAAEAYLQDMARPLKNEPRFGQAYRGAEARAEKVIGEALGVTFPMPPQVKAADEIMLVTEARDLMHGTSEWTHYTDVEPEPIAISPWSPRMARRKFLARYNTLAVVRSTADTTG